MSGFGWRWVVGTAAAAAVAVWTWTLPYQPFSAPTPAAVSAVVVGEAPAATEPELRVASPWAAGRPELGVHLYWVNNPTDSAEVVRAKARRLIAYVIGLEANSVAVSFPFFSDSLTSSGLRTDERTPSADEVAIVVDEARRAGLRTTLRPLLDEANLIEQDRRAWRGKLAPADRAAWFASYAAFLAPYLTMAQRHGVDTVIIAAELNALQDDARWTALVAQAHAVYQGELAYSANWDAYAEARRGVAVDVVGVDAYPQLGLTARATQAEMTAAWTAWFARTGLGPGTVLTEVGAAAEASTLKNPAVPHSAGSPLDEDVQKRWLAAACQAARDRGLGGLYWWKIGFHVDPAAAEPLTDLHDSFIGRRAEPAMRACFTAWGAAR
jgi:hypothetical protein